MYWHGATSRRRCEKKQVNCLQNVDNSVIIYVRSCLCMSDSVQKHYKLGEFAALAGVSTKSLQRWDKNGVLVADRTDGYHRSYTDDHLRKLRQLQAENSSKLTRKKNFQYRDLTGCDFDKLHVIRRADDWIGPNGHRHIQWLCKCKCGNEIVVKGSSLISGYRKSCGCSRYGDNETKRMWAEFNKLTEDDAKQLLAKIPDTAPTLMVDKPVKPSGVLQDLTNQTFGLWHVLGRAETRHYAGGGQAVCWLCECECGTIKSVPGRDLKSGASQSCGCLHGMSKLEHYTRCYLQEHGIVYDFHKSYPDLRGTGGKLLSFDFVLLKDGCPYAIIECQGEQHYRPIGKFGGAKKLLRQQLHDKLKANYASSVLHVPLYEVSYRAVSKDVVYAVLDKFNL